MFYGKNRLVNQKQGIRESPHCMSSWAKSKFCWGSEPQATIRYKTEERMRRWDLRASLGGFWIDVTSRIKATEIRYEIPLRLKPRGFSSLSARKNFDWRLPPSQRWQADFYFSITVCFRGVEDVAPYKIFTISNVGEGFPLPPFLRLFQTTSNNTSCFTIC